MVSAWHPSTDLPKIGSPIPMTWSQKERRAERFKCTCENTYLFDLIFLQQSVEINQKEIKQYNKTNRVEINSEVI